MTLEQLIPQLASDPRPSVIIGDAWLRYGTQIQAVLGERCHPLPAALWVPQAAAVCRLAAQALASGCGQEPQTLNPRYLYSKESDITGW